MPATNACLSQARAAIVESGGALLVDALLTDEYLEPLGQECIAARSSAREQLQQFADTGGWRSAAPARHFLNAEGGPVQDALYADRALHRTLSDWCGADIRPSSVRGTYSYYEREGHYLALHRDVRRCDVTLITCLFRRDTGAPSGALRLYPAAVRTPLEALVGRRVDPAPSGRDLRAHGGQSVDLHPQPGQSVLLLGGCVPHEVLPATVGHLRWISVLCFEMSN